MTQAISMESSKLLVWFLDDNASKINNKLKVLKLSKAE